MDESIKKEMYDSYQAWVVKSFGDQTRTKTITLKKQARIFKILRGEEQLCAENSKFRFWVRNKGFRISPPEGYVFKPADAIIGRNSLEDEKEHLYVPGGNKDIGSEYKRVAIVENFFDIIFAVHVEIDGRPEKHAGQKRTYRTITETYAFLPREAVTMFLVNCAECQKRPTSDPALKISKSVKRPLKFFDSLFLTPVEKSDTLKPKETEVSETMGSSNCGLPAGFAALDSVQNSPENLCNRDGGNKTAIRKLPISIPRLKIENNVHTSTPTSMDTREESSSREAILDLVCTDRELESPLKKRRRNEEDDEETVIANTPSNAGAAIPLGNISTGSDTSDSSLENVNSKGIIFRHPFEIRRFRRGIFERNRIGENPKNTFSISYPMSKYEGGRKSVNHRKCTDAFQLGVNPGEEVSSAVESENTEEETPYSGTKEAEKLKMMLLAWSGGRNGDRLPEDVPDEASQIWAGYHNALSLSKQTPPIRSSPTQETGSVHDETSSSGNKDDDDDEEEEAEEKIDPMKYDPERLKAFNMFVRLFVDENLDRIVPISKQPKEKIQAIIDSCTRQFPEFSERARKRIRTYLKSCRRNKRTREGNSAWEPQSRPTPAHLTSVQAEQILAQACENESHNAKRMRLGLEPVTQPMPGMTTDTSTTVRSQGNSEGTRERDHYTSPVSSTNTVEKHSVKHDSNSGSVSPTVQTKSCSLEALAIASANSLSPSLLNGSAPPSSVAAAVVAAAAAPTAMYRPNFSQAFQRATAGGTYTTPGLFSLPCSLTNGTRPTDLSMKNKPLLTHKLSPTEITAVRQLITGYRESAAFLLRSADELEQLLRNQ